MGWASSVSKVISAVSQVAKPPVGGGGGGISITGSQHVDNSVNTNITAGDNSFNEDASTNLNGGSVQANVSSENQQSATGSGTITAPAGDSLAHDAAQRDSALADSIFAALGTGSGQTGEGPAVGPGSPAALAAAGGGGSSFPTWAKIGLGVVGLVVVLGGVFAIARRK